MTGLKNFFEGYFKNRLGTQKHSFSLHPKSREATKNVNLVYFLTVANWLTLLIYNNSYCFLR